MFVALKSYTFHANFVFRRVIGLFGIFRLRPIGAVGTKMPILKATKALTKVVRHKHPRCMFIEYNVSNLTQEVFAKSTRQATVVPSFHDRGGRLLIFLITELGQSSAPVVS